jgi:hypothetical protein
MPLFYVLLKNILPQHTLHTFPTPVAIFHFKYLNYTEAVSVPHRRQKIEIVRMTSSGIAFVTEVQNLKWDRHTWE